jgi:hypothetical protein
MVDTPDEMLFSAEVISLSLTREEVCKVVRILFVSLSRDVFCEMGDRFSIRFDKPVNPLVMGVVISVMVEVVFVAVGSMAFGYCESNELSTD